MKKFTGTNRILFYIGVLLIPVVGESFAIKYTMLNTREEKSDYEATKISENGSLTTGIIQYFTEDKAETEQTLADSLDFQVKVVEPHKFLLSFYKKRQEAFYIKIYDVIGNLVYHEVVSSKGKFKKEYDLSKYTTDLYVIEVSSGKATKTKRLFLG